jgi:hypothetical protein
VILLGVPQGSVADETGKPSRNGWMTWFSRVTSICNDVLQGGGGGGVSHDQDSGNTRPTTGLYPGRPFFDTSLGTNGQKIFVGADGVGWVDGLGLPV